MVKDYKWLVNLQSRTWRNFKHQNPMMKRTWKIHLSANYVMQSKSKLKASLENPVGALFFRLFFLLNFSYIQVLKYEYILRNQLCNILYTYYPCIDHIHIWLKKG